MQNVLTQLEYMLTGMLIYIVTSQLFLSKAVIFADWVSPISSGFASQQYSKQNSAFSETISQLKRWSGKCTGQKSQPYINYAFLFNMQLL